MVLTCCRRFLHAALHLDQIVQCKTPDDVYSNLDHFPEDLDSFYDRAWEKTSGKDSLPSSQRARLVLMWVVHAKQPLTVDMLEELFTRSENLARYTLRIDEDFASSCAGFICIEPSLALPGLVWVKLVHPSAYRYLDKRKTSYFPHAEDMIAATYLSVSSADDVVIALLRYIFSVVEYVLYISLIQHGH